jgi:hypothetical protein
MVTLNTYIEQIERNDTGLTYIDLGWSGLNDSDANRLMEALRNAPEVANNIETITLVSNQITSVNIPDTLIALQTLRLDANRLTNINIPDTLIALERLSVNDNQLLTSVNLPDTLIALQEL